MSAFRKAFDNWEKEILRPILTTVLTAIILFAGSLAFKPVRTFFFPSEVTEYPLHCTAEPYADASREFLLVDFFIINRTESEYSRDDLNALLRMRSPDPDAEQSPDIHLEYSRMLDGKPLGRFEGVIQDDEFNAGKGELQVELVADKVTIKVIRIAKWAVMKVTITVAGLPDVNAVPMSRMAKTNVPFDFRPYQDGCYSR